MLVYSKISTHDAFFCLPRRTDGMGWGPSRVRDEFLFYHQKDSDVDSGASASPWGDTMRCASPVQQFVHNEASYLAVLH
jgi:hypothetical protein